MNDIEEVESVQLGEITKSRISPILQKCLKDNRDKDILFQDKVSGYSFKILIRVEKPETFIDEFGTIWKKIGKKEERD